MTENLETIAMDDIDTLLLLDSEMLQKRMELKELRAEFVKKLPVCSDAQFHALCGLVRQDAEIPDGLKVNEDFRLTDDQVAHLKTVRDERKKWCAANKAAVIAEVSSNELEVLTRYTVRVGAKKTRKTMVFERSVDNTPTSLIGRLRAGVGKSA